MCSFVDEWSLFHRFRNSFKIIIERILVFAIWFIVYSKKYISQDFMKSPIFKLGNKVFREFLKGILDEFMWF